MDRTALHEAASRGELECLKLLLADPQTEVNAQDKVHADRSKAPPSR